MYVNCKKISSVKLSEKEKIVKTIPYLLSDTAGTKVALPCVRHGCRPHAGRAFLLDLEASENRRGDGGLLRDRGPVKAARGPPRQLPRQGQVHDGVRRRATVGRRL